MKDKEFLLWLHDRLVYQHNENFNVDYMHRLRSIINDLPEDKETANVCRSFGGDYTGWHAGSFDN